MRHSWALMGMTMVLSDISNAPAAGESKIFHDASTFAISGRA